ncbi:glutamine synthetase [Rubrivivax sp. RP6-9]|uniref:glutamine synthetase n=1 Tax=Rubrivivax sp. RP6-9 TaxID=3415750 RepID=UPI003CC533EB
MSCFAQRCGVFDAAAAERVQQAARDWGLDQVRIAWGDLHGAWRGKTLMPGALRAAFEDGVGMVSTLLLKDSADRTALPVFASGALQGLPGLAGLGRANNVLLLPDPDSFRVLPWAPGTGWLQAQPWFEDGSPVPIDPRGVLQAALKRLADAGFGLTCGLEVEFHVYRITDARDDPAQAAWPAEPPAVALLHPGWQLLSEAHADACDDMLALVRRTAQGLGLPLRSLEIEMGPSQFEAVFDATDALAAADQMLLFRNGVRQALRRAGFLATFVCRPPFDSIMSSGWHLHQSLRRLADGSNAFVPHGEDGDGSDAGTRAGRDDARHWLSAAGSAWLAGLLAHARGAALCAVPTVNGYERFRPDSMAPVAVQWGRDHRGTMLRVLGGPGDAATRIENRLGEPLANPYLYIASQVHAGLDGLQRGLQPPPATDALDGAGAAERLPAGLPEAIAAFEADATLTGGLGAPLAAAYSAVKRAEQARHDEADDPAAWQRREYFGRY